MAEIECFIEFQNGEPFMMTLDKDVNFQTFDEEIKKRLAKYGEKLSYSYTKLTGKTTILNDDDLDKALIYAEAFGESYLFVITVTVEPKISSTPGESTAQELNQENENLLEKLEELENLVPEEQMTDDDQIPEFIPDLEPEENIENNEKEQKESDKKEENKMENIFDFFKKQIPALSPIFEALNLDEIVDSVNNLNNENKEKKEGLEELPSFIKQFFPVLNNLQQAIPTPPPRPAPSQSKSNPQSPNQSSPSQPKPNPQYCVFDLFNGTIHPSVNPQNRSTVNNEAKKSAPLQVHYATCDLCEKAIAGIRYKCLSCPDFDLCSKCEERSPQIHNRSHVFAKIRNVNQVIPSTKSRAPPAIPFVQPVPHRPQQCFVHPVNSHPSKAAKFHHFAAMPQPKATPVNHCHVRQNHSHRPVHHINAHPIAPQFVSVRPQPAPEDNRVKSLENQLASLESSIASIKSSIHHMKEEPKPRYSRYPAQYYYEDDEDNDNDQVFEIKVNRRGW